MLSHVFIRVSDFERAYDFYSAVFDAMGVQQRFVERDRPWAGWQSSLDPRPLFLVGTPCVDLPQGNETDGRVNFDVSARTMVDAAYQEALAHGGIGESAPGLRVSQRDSFYGAEFLDPDGNRLCAICYTSAG